MLLPFIIGLAVSFFNIPRKKKMNNFSETDARTAIQEVANVYNRDVAAIVEKILRLESGHFKSKQFKLTGSGGMESTTPVFPFGWSSLRTFWQLNPQFKPTGTIAMKEAKTGKMKTFIVFPSVTAAALSMAVVLKLRNFNAGSWFSTKKELQDSYNLAISKIKTVFA